MFLESGVLIMELNEKLSELEHRVLANLEWRLIDRNNKKISFEDAKITREYAMERWGVTDRAFRAAVRRLRKRGFPIASDSQDGGYFLAKDREEAKHFMAEMWHRVADMMETARNIEKYFIEQEQKQEQGRLF